MAPGDNALDRAIALQSRSKSFALRTIRMFRSLPRAEDARILGRQAFRSATSMAANYRAACRARSKPEFCAKIGIVVEEADETVFWLELLIESEVVAEAKMMSLLDEARELLAIFSTAQQTARGRMTESKERMGPPSPAHGASRTGRTRQPGGQAVEND